MMANHNHNQNHTAMVRVAQFNQLGNAAATACIVRCCGSSRWVARMVAARPYDSVDEITAAADRHWRAMQSRDFLEAFRSHPKIGQAESEGRGDTPTAANQLADSEQAQVRQSSPQIRESLAQYNHDYEKKFGFIFIVCARGKSAEQMLRILQFRLSNTRAEEIANAAEQQRKIMQLRLRQLFAN